MKLKDLQKELKISYYGDNITYYSSGYIQDLFSEIADQNVDIYTSDLLDWAKLNYEYIEQAVQEFGIDSRNFDFVKLLQEGQFLQIEEDLYNSQKEIIIYYIFQNLIDAGVEELTEEQSEAIDEKDILSFETLEDVNEFIEELKQL